MLVALIPASAYGYFAGGGKDAAKGNDCLIGYEGIEARDVTLDGKKQVVTCTDCDPGCDHDGDSTANGSCTFQVGVCINQTIEGCTPSSALDKAKANGTVKGVKGSGGKIVIDVSQLLTGSECGGVVAVVTPINAKKREGSATLKLSALAKKNKAEGITKTRKDTDTLTYVCVRRPAGELCPVSTTTSSTMTSTTTTTIVTSGAFPATGQTTCWNSAGTVIPCADTGHDGDVRAGAPLAYQDNGDGTVTDLNTGLMWEKLSDDGSIHDKDNVYTWDDAFAVKVATLNAGAGFAGHTDWRVPNVKELQSIVNYESVAPAVSVAFNTACAPGCTVTTCSCTASSGNVSSSTIASRPMSRWGVSMNSAGVVGCCGGSSVRAVRGGLVTPSGAGSAAGGRRGRLLRSLPQR